MKSFFNCLILCGLVVLVGCSGSSQKQPAGTTTTQTDVWQITALDASNSNPIVNTSVSVTATVTLNGDPAPDGTKVEFTANGGIFSNGATLATVLSTGGQASIGFSATDAGGYIVQARVRTVTRQITITYRNPDTSGGLQLWSINPAAGSYAGGESVILTGKGIRNPVAVFFTVQGVEYQAIVDQVVPSVPATAAGTITIRTPQPTAADTDITSASDVKVTVGVGTGDEETQSYPAVFTYISDAVIVGDPVIFGVQPPYGRSRGGELVFILGLDFAVDETKELVKNFDQVFFVRDGQELVAQVERWSESQIEVITPRFSLSPLEDDQNWGVKLTREGGDDPVVKDDVFIVQKDIAEPEITGLSPTGGPLDGGTVVTITGHGFEIPVQVHFGDLEATEIQVFDDQSLADNDVITCKTPDYSQQGQVPPVIVTVRVTNLQTGNNATSSQTFRYGDLLYVGQANPTEGQIGDLFTLYGAGFEDPLTVWFLSGGEIEFDVISVTGTELTLRSPPDMEPTCVDRFGRFRVVLNESNRFAEGGDYTLLGSNPTVTSVEPIFVDETDNGNGVSPNEIDIYGVRFADDLLVRINNYTITPDFVTVDTPEHIYVSQIPAPNDFNLVFETTACTTGSGLQGVKQIPTAVNVTVRNLPLGCENTLNQTLVYVPQDQSCLVAPTLQVVIPTFPVVEAGTCSPPEQLLINNTGAGTLDIHSLFLQGRFFFRNGFDQEEGPIVIPPFGSNNTLDLYFCPDVPTGANYSGQLVITSNNPGGPNTYGLNGTEATPPEITTNPSNGQVWDFGDDDFNDPGCTPEETLTVTNSGVSTLHLGPFNVPDGQFVVTMEPPTVLEFGESGELRIQFCASAAGPQATTLSIGHDAVNEPDPIVISLTGNGI